MTITDDAIEQFVKSINPENNPQYPKGSQTISFTLDNNSITYYFENFEKVTTLRLSLEDLLEHLSFSKDITKNFKIKKN